MKFKDKLTKHTYGSLLDKIMRPKLGPVIVPRATAVEAKKVPNIQPPGWSKNCSNEMWAGNLDMNMDGSMSGFSLDPILRAFYVKKEEVLTEVLGWLTSQAPDSVRPALLAALQAKRMMELAEFIKCAEKILSNIRKLAERFSTGLRDAMNSLNSYMQAQVRMLQLLEAQLLNLPNVFIDTMLEGVVRNFNSYINTMKSSAGLGDALAFASAIAGLAQSLTATLYTLQQAQASINYTVAAGLHHFQSFLKNVEKLTDLAAIQNIQSQIPPRFGWMASGPPEGQCIYNALLGATEATWYIAVTNANTYLFQQISVSQSNPNYTEARDNVIQDLSRKSDSELSSYRNPEFVTYATTEEVAAYHAFVMAPDSEKRAKAEILIDLIVSMQVEEQLSSTVRPAQIRAIESALELIRQYQNVSASIEAAKAQMADLEESQERVQQKIREVNAIDLAKDFDEIASLESAALSMTVTNDANMFEDYDGVTTYDLVRRLSNWGVNQWYDVYSSNAIGTLVMPSADMISISVAKSAYQLNQNRALGLRVIINNGLWILDCYARGNPAEDANLIERPFVTTYGRFSSVPTTPNPSTTMPMTYEQWTRAINHPSSTIKDPDYIIVNPPTTMDLSTIRYHEGNTNTSGSWLRYLTQQEIYEREKDYLEVLQMLKLSVRGGYHITPEEMEPLWTYAHYVDPVSGSTYSRIYSMPEDTQVKDLMLNKKPYTNMQIPIKSIGLQFSKIASQSTGVNEQGQPITFFEPFPLVPSTSIPFAFSASWGFVAKVV